MDSPELAAPPAEEPIMVDSGDDNISSALAELERLTEAEITGDTQKEEVETPEPETETPEPEVNIALPDPEVDPVPELPEEQEEIPTQESSENWKQLRSKYEEVSKRAGALEAALREKATPPVSTEPELTATQAFQYLLKVDSGELDGTWKQKLDDELDKHSAEEIAQVAKDARLGRFGEDSDAILNLTSQFASTAVVNDRRREQAIQKQREQESVALGFKKAKDESFKRVVKELGVKKASDPQYREFAAYYSKLIEEEPDIVLSPSSAEYAYKRMKSDKLIDEHSKLKEENETLKKRLNIRTSPSPGTHSAGGAGASGGKTPEQELQEAIMGLP